MNDNYFPKNQLILTENEKNEFLSKLPSMVKLDEKIEECVKIVNDMPYFLTQSSCQGQGGEINSTHTPVPYLTIGVLYNAFELLDELAGFLLEKLKKKISTLNYSFEVQAINRHSATGVDVPNFQKYLTVSLKSHRSIEALEEALREFSQKELSINTNVQEIIDKQVQKAISNGYLFNDMMDEVRFPTPKKEASAIFADLKQTLSEIPALKTIKVQTIPANNGYPECYVLEFYVVDDQHNIDDFFHVLTSALTGGLIANELFQPTTSGKYLRMCQCCLFNVEKADFFATLVKKWAKEGHF
ncbi:hypothetical protein CVD28_02695 [Bacillus sp. M6-12]|uniref:hypothetical protein n=1 Tax=Bacillus sp. M6-12 TaxID=2054166 RepID=UPI000C789EC1|nr:hypothetical protein [Bacillus sp. M6-12]PLS19341.1 hypothetical protein CVD28_02695 [Bacillus sp. M6-12]